MKYKMLYCHIEKKITAHKIFWNGELNGLKVRYFASILCGNCIRKNHKKVTR